MRRRQTTRRSEATREDECGRVGYALATAVDDKLAAMEVTFVKAGRPGERDRVYLTIGGVVRRGPVHVVHDLPHLVVESAFGIDDGLWAELEAGRHARGAPASRSLRGATR